MRGKYEQCKFKDCGEMILKSAMSSHWVLRGHLQTNPAVRVTTPTLDALRR